MNAPETYSHYCFHLLGIHLPITYFSNQPLMNAIVKVRQCNMTVSKRYIPHYPISFKWEETNDQKIGSRHPQPLPTIFSSHQVQL